MIRINGLRCKVAESEGFEPPVPFRVRLISSQVHSTGLCQLSAFLQLLTRCSLDGSSASGNFGGTLYRRNALHCCLLVIHTKMRLPLAHLRCAAPQEFPDRVQIHAGHNQSTGEGMAIAMPRIVFEPGSLNGEVSRNG